MRIEGVTNKDINEVTFKHNGKYLNFRCITKPLPYDPFSNKLIETTNTTIIFDDIMEIENLIKMLTRMRKECSEYFGIWEECKWR